MNNYLTDDPPRQGSIEFAKDSLFNEAEVEMTPSGPNIFDHSRETIQASLIQSVEQMHSSADSPNVLFATPNNGPELDVN